MDKLSPEQRHKNMAAIHSKNTKPEMIVRKGLWSRGFRYRLNHKRLPGHPDLVLRKYSYFCNHTISSDYISSYSMDKLSADQRHKNNGCDSW